MRLSLIICLRNAFFAHFKLGPPTALMNPKISLLQPQISRLLVIASPILIGISSVKAEPTWITPPKESTSTKGSFSTTFAISKPVSAASLRVAASTKGNVQLNAENLGAAPAVFDVKGKVLPALNTLARACP